MYTGGVYLLFTLLEAQKVFNASTIHTMLSYIFNQFCAQSETTYLYFVFLLFEEENQEEEEK